MFKRKKICKALALSSDAYKGQEVAANMISNNIQ